MHGVVILPLKRVEVSRFAPNSGRFLAPSKSGSCNEFGRDYTKSSELVRSLAACCSPVGSAQVRPPRAAIPCAL